MASSPAGGPSQGWWLFCQLGLQPPQGTLACAAHPVPLPPGLQTQKGHCCSFRALLSLIRPPAQQLPEGPQHVEWPGRPPQGPAAGKPIPIYFQVEFLECRCFWGPGGALAWGAVLFQCVVWDGGSPPEPLSLPPPNSGLLLTQLAVEHSRTADHHSLGVPACRRGSRRGAEGGGGPHTTAYPLTGRGTGGVS